MNNTRRNRKQINYRLALFHFRESKYYPFFFHGSIILLCLLLIYFVIIPLTGNLISINKAVEKERQRIGILNQNITYLTSLSDSDTDQNVLLANDLLPKTKDFNDAIQALGSAAASASATIENLAFAVGGVKGNAASKNQSGEMVMTVSLLGTPANFVDFLLALDNRVPLMSVQDFSLSKDIATVQIHVAYQPYVEKSIDLEHTLLAPSASTFSLLQNAADWKNQSVLNNATASASASSNLPPF